MENGFDQTMTFRLQVFLAVSSILLLLTVIHLIRRGSLKEGYSILWLAVSVVALAFSLWSNLLFAFANAIGVYYAPAAVFMIIFIFLFLILLHFSIIASKQETQIKELTQEMALLKHEQKSKRKPKK